MLEALKPFEFMLGDGEIRRGREKIEVRESVNLVKVETDPSMNSEIARAPFCATQRILVCQ